MTLRLSLLALLFLPAMLNAEPYNAANGSYAAMREIDIPNTKSPVIITQFLHQGLINLSAKNTDPRIENAGKTILVATKSRKPVPFRILQLGPGDYCRIAIQNVEKSNALIVYYGIPTGKQPNQIQVPAWTDESGLLFEARWVDGPFKMNALNAVKKAFEDSKRPVGADYVETVFHGFNPLSLRKEPFLSKYSGTLNITQGGNYALAATAHHCCFLVIDGKIVVEKPGQRGVTRQARPEIIKYINLAPGQHSFEYYHAAADDQCSMVAAWQHNPDSDPKKLKLSLIPKENFIGFDNILRVPAGSVKFADSPGSPDFVCQITGSVPLPGSGTQLIGVQFRNQSSGLAVQGKQKWFFGDGQTSEELSPLHIYLKPGTYTVRLESKSVSQLMTAENRIEVAPPNQAPDAEHLPTLDQYLTVIGKYDASQLDADALRQLTEIYQAKIDAILNQTPAERDADEKAMLEGGNARQENRPGNRPVRAELRAFQKEQVTKFRQQIVQAVRAALVENPNFKGDGTAYKLTLFAGGIARDYLLDEKLAEEIYAAGAKKQSSGDFAAECYALAADAALDNRDKEAAVKYLDEGEKKRSKTGASSSSQVFYRVQADYLADTGKAAEARAAIVQAEKSGNRSEPYLEQVAMQGSASRSAENFLANKNYERMADALRSWQRERPGAAYDGFITLLMAKYWLGRGRYIQSAMLADRQIVLNPDSPYIDELLLTAAEAEEKLGNEDAAKAYLNSLIKDYPGSPFVPEAKKKMGN